MTSLVDFIGPSTQLQLTMFPPTGDYRLAKARVAIRPLRNVQRAAHQSPQPSSYTCFLAFVTTLFSLSLFKLGF